MLTSAELPALPPLALSRMFSGVDMHISEQPLAPLVWAEIGISLFGFEFLMLPVLLTSFDSDAVRRLS